MLSGILITLQDASNRGRLEGTTFVQLNYLAAVVFGSMALAGGVPTLATASATTWVAALCAAFCARNAVVSQMKKRRAKE